MTRRLVFRPEAESELAEAADWYEARGNGLGAEFLRAIDAAIAHIERNPFAYQLIDETVRRAPVRRFPYSVIYHVSDYEIAVVACFHGRRDPNTWKARKA